MLFSIATKDPTHYIQKVQIVTRHSAGEIFEVLPTARLPCDMKLGIRTDLFLRGVRGCHMIT